MATPRRDRDGWEAWVTATVDGKRHRKAGVTGARARVYLGQENASEANISMNDTRAVLRCSAVALTGIDVLQLEDMSLPRLPKGRPTKIARAFVVPDPRL